MSNTAVARSRNQARYYGSGRDWETPSSVFEPLDAEFHFTLDPCCRPETAKCARYFTEEDDGLAQSWAGECVFMNPPYGREIASWTRKARQEAEHGALVVGLLPASTDLGWWHEDVLAAGAEVRFIRGRVRFLARAGGQRIGRIERPGLFGEYEGHISADGKAWANSMIPNAIVIWRPLANDPDGVLHEPMPVVMPTDDLADYLEAVEQFLTKYVACAGAPPARTIIWPEIHEHTWTIGSHATEPVGYPGLWTPVVYLICQCGAVKRTVCE